MSGRKLAALALVAVAVVAAVVATQAFERDETPSKASGGRLLPGLSERLVQLRAVRARGGDGGLIARVEQRNDRWVVTNRWDYPADAARIRKLLDQLVAARRVAPKTDDPSAYERIGVQGIGARGSSALAVTLEGLGDGLTVLLGDEAPGDVAGRYVRVAGNERAWHVEPAIDRPDEVADWLDTRLVDIPTDEIVEVTIGSADGRAVQIRRDSDGELRIQRPPGREPLSDTTAHSIARVVADLHLEDVRPGANAPEWPVLASTRFTTRSGLIVQLRLRAPSRGNARHFVRLAARTRTGATARAERRKRRLNDRWAGWVYTIVSYKRTNATRRLEDVLAPERGS